jgi:hypothetical protein
MLFGSESARAATAAQPGFVPRRDRRLVFIRSNFLAEEPPFVRPDVVQSPTGALSLASPRLPSSPSSLLATMSDAIAPASRHMDAEHEKHSEHSSTDAEELAANGHHGPAFYAQADQVPKTAGVLRIEAVARAKNTKSGRKQLYIIGACVVLMYFVYSMQSSTTYLYAVYATSSFASHSSGIATLGVATSLISAVSKPCTPLILAPRSASCSRA